MCTTVTVIFVIAVALIPGGHAVSLETHRTVRTPASINLLLTNAAQDPTDR